MALRMVNHPGWVLFDKRAGLVASVQIGDQTTFPTTAYLANIQR
jgi:hypothetical protein